jgi:two-component system sensor histidine kinase DesK
MNETPALACGQRTRPMPRRFRAINLVWLAYSVFFFIEPAERATLSAWGVTGLMYACFLALYLGLVFGNGLRLRTTLAVLLALLGIAYYPFNAGAGVVFIYVAAFIPVVTESMVLCLVLIVAAAATAALEGWLLGYSAGTWGIFAFFTLPSGASNLFWIVRARSDARLTMAQEQIEHLAQVAERERIARDLHDVLGHTLSLIVLKSELAGKLLPADPGRAQQEIAEVEQTARRALAEVRETIGGYRSEGLAAELDRARETLALAGVTLEHETPLPRLAPLVESALSLVLRECVTNIVRHARAARCRLTIAADPERTFFEISDDGRGGIEHEGNGLRGMRERLATLGGRLAIDSDQGTRLRVEIPATAPLAQGSGA